jgi:DNA replication protein DnaC
MAMQQWQRGQRESSAQAIWITWITLSVATDRTGTHRSERRVVERRIRQARFPAVKSLDTFDFVAIPSLNKMLVLELARCEYILRRDNIIALGNSGTRKTHIGLSLGLAAYQKGFSVAFTTAASLVRQFMEARDERRLLKLQRDLAGKTPDHR